MMREVCEMLGRRHAVPYVYAVEKRYAVCAKFVDTVFDPLYNPKISFADLSDPPKRQHDAEFFYREGGSLIDEFAEAYRMKDPVAVRQNVKNWVAHLKTRGLKQEAGKLASVLPKLDEETTVEFGSDGAEDVPRGIDSLNFPIVMQVFQFVEQNCPYPCDIIHDQTAAFEPIFLHFFRLFTQGVPRAIEMKDGRKMSFGFRNALSLTFADSKTEPIIRAADYALAGTRRSIQLALAGDPIPLDITKIAFGTLGPILLGAYALLHPSLEPMPTLSGYMASKWWTERVFGRLQNEMRTTQNSGGW